MDILAGKSAKPNVTPEVISLVAQRANSIVIITDKDRNILWVNDAFEEITGYDFKDVIGKNPNILYGTNTDKKTVYKIERAINLGKEIQVEIVNYDKKGETYWVDAQIIPIKNEKGDVVNVVSLKKDITAQKNYEEKLNKKQYQLDAYYNSISEYNVFVSPEGKVISYSEQAKLMVKTTTGLDLKEGELFTNFMHPDWVSNFADNLQRVLDTKTKTERIDKIAFSETIKKWLNISYTPIFDNNKNILGVAISAFDISKQKEAELELKSSDAKLRAIIDSANESHYLLDEEMNILSFNKFAKKATLNTFGKEPKIGESILKYTSSETLSDFINNFNIALKTKKEISLERQVNYPDGNIHFFRIRYTPVFNDAGKLLGISFSTRDITDLRQSEIKIRESEYKLKAIYESSHDSTILIDKKFNIIYFNNATKSLFKKLFNENVETNHPLKKYIDASKYKGFYKKIKLVKQTLKPQNLEGWGESYSDDDLYFLVKFTPVIERGQLSGIAINILDITERKKIELLLQQSEAKLRAVFDNSKFAYYFVNKSGVLLGFNKSAEHVIYNNHKKQLTIGNKLTKYLNDDQKELFKQALKETVEKNDTITYERELKTASESFWYKVTYTPVYSDAGELLGISIVSDDITKTKHADMNLITSEAKLRAVFENSHEAQYFIDTNRILLAYNKKAKELRNTYNIDIELNKPFETFVPLSQVKQFKANVSKCISTQKEIVFNRTYPTNKGHRHFTFRFNPVYNEKDNLWGILISQVDTTHSEASKRQIIDSENKLRAVYESTLDANILLDTNYHVVSYNKRALVFMRTFHHKRLKVGANLLNLVDEEREILKAHLDEVITKKRPLIIEDSWDHKSGVIAHFIFSYMPTTDSKGNIIGISINIVDITSHKAYEEELEHKNKTLAEIASVQSHGLRRPLANILGLSYILEKIQSEEKIRETVKMILTSAKQLDQEVHDIVNKATNNDSSRN